MSDNTDIIARTTARAKHWAIDNRKAIPLSMQKIFDSVENEYFNEFKVCCEAHPHLFKGKVSSNLLAAETIVRASFKRTYAHNPAILIIRNLAIACLETFGELNRHAIKQICKTKEQA